MVVDNRLNPSSQTGSQVNHERPSTFTAVVAAARSRVVTIALRMSPLWVEIDGFARWVEDGVPTDRTHPVVVRVEDNDSVAVDCKDCQPLGRWGRLWRFLRGFGIHELELDPRLECNQVSDVLTLIFGERRRLRSTSQRRSSRRAAQLLSDEGLTVACTVTRLHDHRLTISYSYCMTRFSGMVQWFKEHQTDLRDHRALFRAAPRYAAVVGLAPMAVFSIYAFNGSWSLLLITSMLGAAVLGGSTYLFFMTVGSLEYDNEEKAHTLQQAYAQVKNYADRIRSDMDRARAVQQRLLPDLSAMPLGEKLEWAASFVPQEDVGGDYFDVALVSPERIAVVFADVSGHGLGAALVTAMIKTTFEEWLARGSVLIDFVRLLNQRLYCLTPDQSFAAVAVGILDAAQNTFTYCNCGHNPYPYLVSVGKDVPRRLDAAQLMILGVLPDIEPKPATIRLKSGDTLLFATDGITEAENELEEEFTTARLEHYLVDNQRLPLKRYVNKLVESVDHFTEGCRQGDDRTMLAVRVR